MTKNRNVNVWSEMHDMTYIKCKCKSEPFLEREVLLKKIVCEAVVSSVTSLDNNVFLLFCFFFQTETNQCLRAWDYCLQNNFCCIRRAVLVITVDCESGNKQCLKRIQQELLDGTIRQYLSVFSILPYVPHFLKACKANFAHLYLQLNNEGECLLLLYTLRNRADPKVRKNLKIYTLVRVAVDNDLTRNSTTYHL